MRSTRFTFLVSTSTAVLTANARAASIGVITGSDGKKSVGIEEGLRRLREGNARFVAGMPEHPRQDGARRSAVAGRQQPFASVVACADSRVAPELVFDQGFGDLFVCRSAGNLIDAIALGSLEFATLNFGTPLVVVLGHSRCGAVAATLDAIDDRTSSSSVAGSVGAVIAAIRPAVEHVRRGDVRLASAVDANAKAVAARVRQSRVLAPKIAAGTVRVVAAHLDIATGRVAWL